MDSVVGVDLSGISGSTKGRTVAAQIALEERPRLLDIVTIRRGIKGDRDLVDWIDERRPRVIAIDAPLTLPHSVFCGMSGCPRCLPGAASYLRRDVDRLAAGMPTAMLAAIAFRGIYLARTLRGRAYEVIETYPRASLRALGVMGSHRMNSPAIAAALTGRVEGVATTDPDELDAIAAALTAADFLRQPKPEPIEGLDGVIWIAASLPGEQAEWGRGREYTHRGVREAGERERK